MKLGKSLTRALGVLSMLLVACAGEQDTARTANAGASVVKSGAKSGAGDSAGAAGMGGEPDANEDTASAVDAASRDLTFVMKGHVDAGGEIQNCMYVQMPLERGSIAVRSAESHYTPGSHHFLVFRAQSQDIPAEMMSEHLCSAAEEGGNFKPTYYEAQAPDSRRVLPHGVAHVFEPGEVLLLTSHYLNTTGEDLDAQATFVLHTVEPEKVEQEAGSIFFYNANISIPPFSMITVTRSCPVAADMHPALLWSHMHSRGVAFTATAEDTSLYETTDWSEPVPKQFPYDPPVTVPAGSAITYSCTYENPSDKTIVQGLSASTNEMCILHGMYWPRADQRTEECFGGTSTVSDPEALE
jgi:hypothetical protein